MEMLGDTGRLPSKTKALLKKLFDTANEIN